MTVIILAAGTSRRFGQDKQLYCIHDLPVIIHTCRAMQVIARPLVIVCRYPDAMRVLLQTHAINADCIQGGDTRAESAYAGICFSITTYQPTRIWLHDGARPWASPDLLARLDAGLTAAYSGCIPVLPVSDTIKRVRQSVIIETLDRTGLVRVQTPQVFWATAIAAAFETQDYLDCPDDASVVEQAGGQINTITGCSKNIKLTYPHDLNHT